MCWVGPSGWGLQDTVTLVSPDLPGGSLLPKAHTSGSWGLEEAQAGMEGPPWSKEGLGDSARVYPKRAVPEGSWGTLLWAGPGGGR